MKRSNCLFVAIAFWLRDPSRQIRWRIRRRTGWPTFWVITSRGDRLRWKPYKPPGVEYSRWQWLPIWYRGTIERKRDPERVSAANKARIGFQDARP